MAKLTEKTWVPLGTTVTLIGTAVFWTVSTYKDVQAQTTEIKRDVQYHTQQIEELKKIQDYNQNRINQKLDILNERVYEIRGLLKRRN